MVNKLTKQIFWRLETFIARAAAKNIQTFIASNYRHGLNLWDLGDPPNEPLNGFLDTFAPKRGWPSHTDHLDRNFATWEGEALAEPKGILGLSGDQSSRWKGKVLAFGGDEG